MSWAVANTVCSGGLRSTQRRRRASLTTKVMLECPASISENPSGGRAAGTCSPNQAVTASARMPSGAAVLGMVLMGRPSRYRRAARRVGGLRQPAPERARSARWAGRLSPVDDVTDY